MPSDGYADWEPTTDPRPIPAGRTTYARSEGGAATFVRQRSAQEAQGGPVDSPVAGGSAPSAPLRPVWPQSAAPRNTAADTAPLDSRALHGRAPTSAPPRPDLPLRPADPPGAAPPPGAPPGGKHPNRKWWLALVAIVAVLVGATAAVLAQRDHDTAHPATDAQGTPGVSPQAGGSPGSTPSGRSGLGASPSVPGATPSAGGGTTPDPAPFRPGVRRTLPGATIQLQNGESFEQGLARSDRSFGPLRMVRVFYPGLPPKWDGSRSDVVNRTVVVSFKAPPREINSGRDDARIAAWFASIPQQYDVYWAYYHEPENDVENGAFTPAEFKAAWRRVAGLANRAGNPRLINTVILMCFTLVPGSRRDFNAYYPGSDLVETLGWDCYNHATKTNRYNPPEAIYARAAAKSRELGKPWGIAETGTTRTKGDSGTGRAAWIRSVMNYLNAQRPLWVTYYNANRAGGDFRLTDALSMQAWKTWCSATPAP
jgi:hypothetical protein